MGTSLALLETTAIPLDAVVLGASPLEPSSPFRVRILGVLWMQDSGARDDKVVCVVAGDDAMGSHVDRRRAHRASGGHYSLLRHLQSPRTRRGHGPELVGRRAGGSRRSATSTSSTTNRAAVDMTTKVHIEVESVLIERVRAVAGTGADEVREFVEAAIERARHGRRGTRSSWMRPTTRPVTSSSRRCPAIRGRTGRTEIVRAARPVDAPAPCRPRSGGTRRHARIGPARSGEGPQPCHRRRSS